MQLNLFCISFFKQILLALQFSFGLWLYNPNLSFCLHMVFFLFVSVLDVSCKDDCPQFRAHQNIEKEIILTFLTQYICNNTFSRWGHTHRFWNMVIWFVGSLTYYNTYTGQNPYPTCQIHLCILRYQQSQLITISSLSPNSHLNSFSSKSLKLRRLKQVWVRLRMMHHGAKLISIYKPLKFEK